MGSVRLSADKESIGVDKRVYRSCLMFFAFLPSELGCLSVIIGEAENGFAKMTKAFRRVEKCVCENGKGISAGGKMGLQTHSLFTKGVLPFRLFLPDESGIFASNSPMKVEFSCLINPLHSQKT